MFRFTHMNAFIYSIYNVYYTQMRETERILYFCSGFLFKTFFSYFSYFSR